MKIKLSSLKNERKRIDGGDWVTYPMWKAPNGATPVRFNVSGLSSLDYQKGMQSLGQELAKKYQGQDIPPDVSYARTSELVASHILHGWEGLDEDYSPELAESLLLNRDFETLLDAVLWCARKIEASNVEFAEETEKNSGAPSATN